MRKIFLNKKLSCLLIALTMVLILLLLIFITMLDQLASFDSKLQELQRLTEAVQEDKSKLEEYKEFCSSNEYVFQWAIDHGMVPEDAQTWIGN